MPENLQNSYLPDGIILIRGSRMKGVLASEKFGICDTPVSAWFDSCAPKQKDMPVRQRELSGISPSWQACFKGERCSTMVRRTEDKVPDTLHGMNRYRNNAGTKTGPFLSFSLHPTKEKLKVGFTSYRKCPVRSVQKTLRSLVDTEA